MSLQWFLITWISVRFQLEFPSIVTRDEDNYFQLELRQHLYDVCTTLSPKFEDYLRECIRTQVSLVDTYTSSWRSSCDDCSTKNVRVQTTYMYYELAIYSFVGSHRYLSLWPIKGSETYAIEEDAAKDDAMIIHAIKKKNPGLSHRNVKEMSNRTHTKPYKCWNSLHVGRKLTRDRTCIIILRTRNATRCSWTTFFTRQEALT